MASPTRRVTHVWYNANSAAATDLPNGSPDGEVTCRHQIRTSAIPFQLCALWTVRKSVEAGRPNFLHVLKQRTVLKMRVVWRPLDSIIELMPSNQYGIEHIGSGNRREWQESSDRAKSCAISNGRKSAQNTRARPRTKPII